MKVLIGAASPDAHPTTRACEWTLSLSSSSSARGPGVHDPAGVEHDGVLGDAARRRRGSARRAAPCVSSQTRSSTRRPRSTSFGASPLVGSSTSSSRFSFSSARAIATICCCPPESVPARCSAALAQLREELVDEVVARRRRCARRAGGSRDGEPGEHVAVLGHVADAAPDDPVRRHARDVRAVERTTGPARRRGRSARAAWWSCRRRCGRAAQSRRPRARRSSIPCRMCDPPMRTCRSRTSRHRRHQSGSPR